MGRWPVAWQGCATGRVMTYSIGVGVSNDITAGADGGRDSRADWMSVPAAWSRGCAECPEHRAHRAPACGARSLRLGGASDRDPLRHRPALGSRCGRRPDRFGNPGQSGGGDRLARGGRAWGADDANGAGGAAVCLRCRGRGRSNLRMAERDRGTKRNRISPSDTRYCYASAGGHRAPRPVVGRPLHGRTGRVRGSFWRFPR